MDISIRLQISYEKLVIDWITGWKFYKKWFQM
jgi:hypothetical protein